MNFTRYAIYYAPPTDADWAQFATRWLGWDMARGTELAHPPMDGIDVAQATTVPRKYGLHATMKPPFRLRDGQSVEALHDACTALANKYAPVTLDGLGITRMGRFLALQPRGDTTQLDALAAACVRDLDIFRAPASEADLNRRRSAGLSPAQDRNLVDWGYPFVLDAFRFHITLSGRLDKPILATVHTALDAHLAPLLPAPFRIDDLGLVGEAADGRFHLIHRYPLSN